MSAFATAVSVVIYVGGTGTGYLPAPPAAAIQGFASPVLGPGYSVQEYTYPGAPWDVPQASAPGLSNVINADSPGTVVIGLSKGAQVARYTEVISKAPTNSVSYVLIGDPDRPHGGLLSHMDKRYPFRYNTTEIYGEYDGFADFPDRPLNIVADINAIAGMLTVHTQYGNGTALDPLTRLNQAVVTTHQNGNGTTTTTKMVPTPQLPIVTILRAVGLPAGPAAQLNTFLKPIVDAGYSRNHTPKATPKPVTAKSAKSVAHHGGKQ